MMPHLGVLSSVHEKAAMEVFERDCLVVLGTCVAAKGEPKPGKTCFKYSISGDVSESGELAWGEVRMIELGIGSTAEVEVDPSRGVDFGHGPGKSVKRTVKGGTVGIILDARGRPLTLPESTGERREAVTRTIEAVDLYPGSGAAPPTSSPV